MHENRLLFGLLLMDADAGSCDALRTLPDTHSHAEWVEGDHQ
jgi:hypothetical protein